MTTKPVSGSSVDVVAAPRSSLGIGGTIIRHFSRPGAARGSQGARTIATKGSSQTHPSGKLSDMAAELASQARDSYASEAVGKINVPGNAAAPLLSLSINDEYRDLTVVCGEHVYSVHRVILCEQSTFFRAACKGQTFLEGRQRLITLRARSTDADDQDLGADDPDIIWFIMQYLYCDHLNDGSTVGKPAPTLRRLKVNAGVFATADKYGMPGLKALAHTNFDIIATEWCKAYISCAVEIAQEVQECWAGIIELVYLDSPSHLKELREVVFKVLACPRVRLLETEMVGAAVERVEGLTYDLVKFARLSVYPHRERHGCLCLGAE